MRLTTSRDLGKELSSSPRRIGWPSSILTSFSRTIGSSRRYDSRFGRPASRRASAAWRAHSFFARKMTHSTLSRECSRARWAIFLPSRCRRRARSDRPRTFRPLRLFLSAQPSSSQAASMSHSEIAAKISRSACAYLAKASCFTFTPGSLASICSLAVRNSHGPGGHFVLGKREFASRAFIDGCGLVI